MPKPWVTWTAIGLASTLLLARLWAVAPLRYLLLALAIVGFGAAVWTWHASRRRRSHDPYDLGELRRFIEEDELARARRVTVPEEADTVLCPHCGAPYPDQFPVCPECRRSP